MAGAALVALTACGQRQPDAAPTRLESPAADTRILCAVGGAATLTPVCTIDHETSSRGTILTIYHPDGGFHRLLVTTDGHGVIAADGAQGASVTIIGPDAIEVTVAGDRYRLPATVAKRPA